MTDRPDPDELRRLMHALREPVGAFVIRLSLIEEEAVNEETREHLESMLASAHQMVKALSAITSCFGLEAGSATPLAILSNQERTISRPALKVSRRESSRQAG